ncbi:MAG: hypothetical protein K0R59_1633 [Sphingobacterium sp.]|jgi:hypothetical protein|nr:hypothetical protein [Sphingobacterium sp.]
MGGGSIDWEKLLAHLDADENKKLEGLSEEETDMLLFAEMVRFELRCGGPEE